MKGKTLIGLGCFVILCALLYTYNVFFVPKVGPVGDGIIPIGVYFNIIILFIIGTGSLINGILSLKVKDHSFVKGHFVGKKKAIVNQLIRASIISIIGIVIFSMKVVSSPDSFVRGISLLPLIFFSAFLGANLREYFIQKKITE